MDVDKIKSTLDSLTLASGEVFSTRLQSIEEKGKKLHLTYDRAGLTPTDKKAVEKEVLAILEGLVHADDVFIFSTSKQSEDVYKAVGSTAPKKPDSPAQLKTGHAPAANGKKKIAGVKNVIAIGSGKGGVGKSTFTSNLAVTLAKSGKKVGVVDADIYGPSLPTLFDKRGERPSADESGKIFPFENYGIKFISFGNFIHEDEPVVWRGPMLGGVLNQFFFDTLWGELDYLLVDLPPGTGDVQLSMIQNLEVDGAIIVSTPQDVALLDARKALHMFDKLGVHVLGMVENMSSFVCDSCNKEHFIYGTGGVSTACGELGVGYLGKIPLEMELRKGADFGKPYMTQARNEGGASYKGFTDVASKVDSYFYPGDNKKSFFGKLFNKDKKGHPSATL